MFIYPSHQKHSVCMCVYSVPESCLTRCDPMDCSMPGLPDPHHLLEFAQVHVHRIGDAIQPSHPLSPSSPLPSIFPNIKVFSSESAVCISGQSIGASASALPMSIGLISFRIDWFDLLAVQRTLKSLLQHHSLKASILWCSAFFMVQLSHLYITIGKTIALMIQTFVSKVMSLLFNMLSRFVMAFFPRSKCLLISWLQAPSTVILEPKKKKRICHCFHFSPSICHEVMGPDATIFVF